MLAPLLAGGDYVGVSVGYRLTDVAPFPAQIHDCKAAIRYVRANAKTLGIDPNKIGVWGSSAGGHLVSLLGTSGDVKEVEGSLGTTGVSSRVTCVVDYCGPSDFPNFQLTSGARDRSPSCSAVCRRTSWRSRSRRRRSPTSRRTIRRFWSSTARPTPPCRSTRALRFHEAQKQGGINTTFVRIENGGHGIGGREVESRVKAFFEKHLLGKDVQVSAEAIQAPPAEQKAK